LNESASVFTGVEGSGAGITLVYTDNRSTLTVHVDTTGVPVQYSAEKVVNGTRVTLYPPYIAGYVATEFSTVGIIRNPVPDLGYEVALTGDTGVIWHYTALDEVGSLATSPEYVTVTIVAKQGDTNGKVLYSYDKQMPLNSMAFKVIEDGDLFNLSPLWILLSGQEGKTVFAPEDNMIVEFYYISGDVSQTPANKSGNTTGAASGSSATSGGDNYINNATAPNSGSGNATGPETINYTASLTVRYLDGSNNNKVIRVVDITGLSAGYTLDAAGFAVDAFDEGDQWYVLDAKSDIPVISLVEGANTVDLIYLPEESVRPIMEPAAAAPHEWALVNLLLTLCTFLVMLMIPIIRQNRSGNAHGGNPGLNKNMGRQLRLQLIMAAIALVAFMLFAMGKTADFLMVYTDRWTAAHVIILIAALITATVSLKDSLEGDSIN
jgi:hypothetical protein